MDELSYWLDKAKSTTEAGCFLSAIAFYEQALEINPNNYEVLTGLGTAFFYCGQYSESIKVLAKALEINFKDPELWDALGQS